MYWLLVSLLYIEAVTIHNIPSSKIGPSPSFLPAIAGNSEKTILFVHEGDGQIDQNQLWELDLKTYKWSILPSFSDLPGTFYIEFRYNHTGFYRQNNQEFCIYGGRNQNKIFNDIWCFGTKRFTWEKLDLYFSPGPFMKFTSIYYEYMNYEFFIVLGIDIYTYDTKVYILDLQELKWEDKGIYVLTLDKSEYLDADYINIAISCADEKIIFVIFHKYKEFLWKGEIDIFTRKFILDKVFLDESSLRRLSDSTGYISIKASLIVNNNFSIILNSGTILYIQISSNTIPYFEFNVVNINNNSAIWCANYSCFAFGGYYLEQLTNGIEKIDFLNDSTINQNLIIESFISPPLRTSTSLKAVHTDLYLFGGKYKSLYLNDLWKYSTKKNLWSKISAKGFWPSSRSSHAASSEGDLLVIWGGENSSGYLNDMFLYNAYTGTWHQHLPYPIISPSKRKNACISLELPNAFIYGGSDSSGPLADLWEYNFRNNSYKKLIEIKPMAKPTCIFNIQSKIIIVNEDYYIEYLIKKNISIITNISKNPDSVITILYKYILFIGGRNKDFTKAHNEISFFKFQDNLNLQIEEFIYDSAHTFYNTSIYIYGGGYLTSEFSLFPAFPMARFVRIDVKDICAESNCTNPCSMGFETTENGGCTLCESGTYANDGEKHYCASCDPGYYNPNQGSTSAYQCLLCPEGTYRDKKGGNVCKACSSEYYCPVHSSYQVKTNYTVNTNPSFQPDIVKSEFPMEMISFLVKISIICMIGVLIFLLTLKKTRKCLSILDLYYNLHNFEDGEYVKITRNLCGGAFSIIFLFLSSIFIGGLISIYILDNQYEEKYMIPGDFSIKNPMNFRINFEAEIRLKEYGGKCSSTFGSIGLTHYGDCGKTINISSKGFGDKSLKALCLPRQNKVCNIYFSCENCELQPGAYFEANIFESRAYAKIIEVNITADSSIPESRSSSFNKITASKNQIFIGYNFTEFHFMAIPSLLSNDFQTINTGYHIIPGSSTILGSQNTVENFAAGLNIRVFIDRKNDVIYTFRAKKHMEMFFICISLGALAGIFAIVGSVMRVCESQTEKLESLRLVKDFNSIKNRNEGLYQMNFNWKVQSDGDLKKKITESTGLIESKEDQEYQCEIISKTTEDSK
ncbi:hypothetical protein SteCoe_4466 [Stentor coeruleus]|uniref:Tyrosine-protein kinase ephrin type A/B receptor-like domain-containing protein n=1 Tax=Stentor coeruleus TaxID=5963 RepID=A0A1R2CUL8_9CILI|nr:hypothetical protein SteCoe_4466 [Stentor coeruleus]